MTSSVSESPEGLWRPAVGGEVCWLTWADGGPVLTAVVRCNLVGRGPDVAPMWPGVQSRRPGQESSIGRGRLAWSCFTLGGEGGSMRQVMNVAGFTALTAFIAFWTWLWLKGAVIAAREGRKPGWVQSAWTVGEW